MITIIPKFNRRIVARTNTGLLNLLIMVMLILLLFSQDCFAFRHLDEEKGHDFILVGLGVFRQNFTDLDGAEINFEDSDDGYPDEYSNRSRLSLYGEGKVYEKYTFELEADYDESDDSGAQDFTAYLKVNRDDEFLILGDHKEGNFLETVFTAMDHQMRGATLHGEIAETSGTMMTGVLRGDSNTENIPADGTSGPYRLENAPVVEGSESIELQVRDRNNPDRILRTQRQIRGVHYTIDYDDSEITFYDPVDSADFRGNPIYIAITYQFESFDGMFNRSVWGGRATAKPHDSVKIGATYLAEGPWQEGFSETLDERRQIMGADMTLDITDRYKIGIEAAQSETPEIDESDRSNAVQVKLDANPLDPLTLYGRYWRVEKEFHTFGNSELASGSVYDELDEEMSFMFKTTDITFDLDPNINANLGVNEESMGASAAYHLSENSDASAGIRQTRDNIPEEDWEIETTVRNMFTSYKYTPEDRTNVLMGAEQVRQYDDEFPRTIDDRSNRFLAGVVHPLGRLKLIDETNLMAAYQYEDYDDYLDESQSEIVHDMIGRIECYPGDSVLTYLEQAEQLIYNKQKSRHTFRTDITAAGIDGNVHENVNIDAGAKYRRRIDLIEDREDEVEQVYTFDITVKPVKTVKSMLSFEYRKLEDKSEDPNRVEDKYVVGGQLYWNILVNLSSRIKYEYELTSATNPDEETERDDFLFRLKYKMKHHFSVLGYYRLENERSEMDPFEEIKTKTTTCLLGGEYRFTDKTDLTSAYKWKYIDTIEDEQKEKFYIEGGHMLNRFFKLALGYEHVEYSLDNHPEEDYSADIGYFSIIMKL